MLQVDLYVSSNKYFLLKTVSGLDGEIISGEAVGLFHIKSTKI